MTPVSCAALSVSGRQGGMRIADFSDGCKIIMIKLQVDIDSTKWRLKSGATGRRLGGLAEAVTRRLPNGKGMAISVRESKLNAPSS
jgi:hypothetical protein